MSLTKPAEPISETIGRANHLRPCAYQAAAFVLDAATAVWWPEIGPLSTPALAAEVEAWLERAREADAAEDQARVAGRRSDKTPDWMADKQRQSETIRATKAALEAEAVDPPDPEDENGPGASSGMRWQGRPGNGRCV